VLVGSRTSLRFFQAPEMTREILDGAATISGDALSLRPIYKERPLGLRGALPSDARADVPVRALLRPPGQDPNADVDVDVVQGALHGADLYLRSFPTPDPVPRRKYERLPGPLPRTQWDLLPGPQPRYQ